MAGVLNVICTVANFVVKGVNVVDAGVKIHQVSKKDRLTGGDKFNIIMQTTFAAIQVLEMGTHAAGNRVPGNVRLGVNATTGFLDVFRAVTHKVTNKTWDKSDTFDIVGLVLFRLGDSLSLASDTHKHHPFICGNEKLINVAIDVSKSGGAIIVQRQNIAFYGGLAWSTAQRKWTQFKIRRQRQQPATVPLQQQTTQSTQQQTTQATQQQTTQSTQQQTAQTVQSQSSEKDDDDFDAEQQAAEKEFQKTAAMALKDWKTMKEIPALFANHPAFPKCKMSGKAIRHIRCPAFDTDDVTWVFDQSSVEEWVKTKATQPPVQNWPEDHLPVKLTDFLKNAPLQKDIDSKLEGLAKLYGSDQQGAQ